MQLPEAPGEQAGIWSGGHVSFSSGAGGGGSRVSLVHLRNGYPQHYGERDSSMGTPKVNFLLFFYTHWVAFTRLPYP